MRLHRVFSFIRIVVCMLPLILPVGAVAADPRFSLEIDPATYLLDGYSLHFRFTLPDPAPNWVFGAGIYRMELPDPLRKMVITNADRDLEITLTQGYGLFAEYSLRPDRQGWFVGGQLGITRFELHNPSLGPDADYTTLLIMPRIGYRWVPFQNGFYLLPWAGIGYTPLLSGETAIGERSYHRSGILPLFTLHLGYQF